MLKLTLKQGDLQRAREWLLDELASAFKPRERKRVTVVFDAAEGPTHLPREQTYESLTIHFSPRDSDADTLIETLLRGHSAPRQIRVVSSDRRLQIAARRRRAQSVSSLQFLDELARRQEQGVTRRAEFSAEHPKRTGDVSEFEANRWLAYFGYNVEDTPTREDEGSAGESAPSAPDNVAGHAETNKSKDTPLAPLSEKPPGQSAEDRAKSIAPPRKDPQIDVGQQIDNVSYWQARIAELDEELAREKLQRQKQKRRKS